MERKQIIEQLEALPDVSFVAAIVAAKAAVDFMSMVVVDDPTAERAFVNAVSESEIGIWMGWRGAGSTVAP